MSSPMRVAVVGMGWWGRQLAMSLNESEGVVVTDIVEPNVAGAEAFAEEMGVKLHASLDPVLADPEIEGVLIATPHSLHEEQVLAVAGAGKHVFCEKPLALNSEAARGMLEACRSKGLALGIGHERRYEGGLEAMAAMATDGDLGTLLHLECNWSHNLMAGPKEESWRQNPDEAPAGTLTALGVHITDYFQSIAGRVSEVTAVSSNRSDTFPGNDVITIQFRFESGVTGTLTNLASTPFYSRVTVFGDTGWAEVREWSNVDIPDPATLTWRGLDNEVYTRTFAHGNTVGANVELWAAAARGDATYRFTDDQLIHNVEILEAIVESSRTRSTVKISPSP